MFKSRYAKETIRDRKIEEFTAEIDHLKKTESTLCKSIADCTQEIKESNRSNNAREQSVNDEHIRAKSDLERLLLTTVKKRNKLTLKLMKVY